MGMHKQEVQKQNYRHKLDIKPVKIHSINDIRKAIKPFVLEIDEKKVPLNSQITWQSEDGINTTSKISSYSSDISMRSKLLEGFEQVKSQKKVWDNLKNALDADEYGSNLPSVNIDDFTMPVDRIIKHRLGGKREGMTVTWILGDKKIVFDPFTKELKEH